MTDRSISGRPSLDQVSAIVDFMEKHPNLGLGQMRGLEGRHESKRLWYQLTQIVNNVGGPNRPMKSWVKYWADKKSTVRSKVISAGGDPNTLGSPVERKIYNLFLSHLKDRESSRVKVEKHLTDDTFEEESGNEDSPEPSNNDPEPAMHFEGTAPDYEERQMLVMEKLVKVMSDQTTAMSQLAHASQTNAQAMERLAEASIIQARAVERLANTFETIGASTHDVRNALVDIDATMKSYYTTTPT
ncbi:uncharacterized protein LOC121739791 isoform X2 [Aricia agestis]|uniref:uncharacterized protein LOC121739791 isoform X2 n=1 Tax=Aricia agestis TaxID=91739 RepID=UPI001C209A04|nr:uncharacterized protein LOC121739791 isoform X2 [Aricia agestis]